MKTTNRIIATIINPKRFFGLLVLSLCLSTGLFAQSTCTASFTYTLGTNGQVSLTNTSVGTTTNTAYQWSWQGMSSWGYSYQTSPTINFTYNGTYYIYLNMSDSNANCQSYVMDSVVITNAQACQVSFTYTIGTNGQVSFTNTSQGNVSYYWNFGDGNSSTLTSPQNTYLYNGTYNVYVWADTTGGYCGGYAQATIVITNAMACGVMSAFTSTNSGSGVFIFTDTVSANPANAFHRWYVNGSYVGFGNPFTYTFNNNGTFTVCEQVQDSTFLGCADSICYNVTVSGMACNDSAYFYLYQDSTQAGVWDAYLYTFNSAYPINAVWTWGDGTSSTGLYPTHTYSTPGWYSICVTAYFACGDSSTYCEYDSVYRSSAQMVTINVINGSNGIHTNTKTMTGVKIYPNPFTDNLTVNLTSYESNNVTCAMYDMMGNLILKENVNVNKGDNEFKLKTDGLNQGVYFINISGSDGKKVSTLKVVK